MEGAWAGCGLSLELGNVRVRVGREGAGVRVTIGREGLVRASVGREAVRVTIGREELVRVSIGREGLMRDYSQTSVMVQVKDLRVFLSPILREK